MERTCPGCGKAFQATRATAKYCGDTCSKRSRRAAAKNAPVVPITRKKGAPATPSPAQIPTASCVSEAVRAELGDKAGTALGMQALALAGRLDGIGTPESAMAGLSRQLTALLDRVQMERTIQVGDEVDAWSDELAARRVKAHV